MASNTLESISEKCGFNNYSYFYKLFIRKNKISPEKWREKKRLSMIKALRTLDVFAVLLIYIPSSSSETISSFKTFVLIS